MPPSSSGSAIAQHITRTIALLVTFVLVAGIGGVLAAGLFAPFATGVSAATNATQSIFDELPEELEPQDLPQQSRIYDTNGGLLAVFYDQNRLIVPLDDISEHLQHAVIATEDRRFYEHGGVDPEGLIRALLVNRFSNRTEGASTLTQQYVKNVLINNALLEDDQAAVEAAREQTEERKLREMKLAITLEHRMTKDQILEGYLNIAQFGSSVYGAEAAAQYYFGVRAKDLSIVQAATIAGVTQAPNRWDPSIEGNADETQQRRDWVLGAMLREEYITQEEYDEAIALSVEETLNVQPVRVGCETAANSAFFCDYVTKVITSDPVFGETQKERAELLTRGGLIIHTTLDPDLQLAAMQEVRNSVPGDNDYGVASVIVTVKPGTGEILAMAQNRAYTTSREPELGYTNMNYATSQNYGGSQGFQPGSTFKPFVLAEWLKQDRNLRETVSAQGRTWRGDEWNAHCVDGNFTGGGSWTPRNVEGSGSGFISVLQATSRSINTAYTTIASELDLCDIADTAKDIGFVPGRNSDEGQVAVLPSMILGSQNVAPLDMANAYATFASGGTHCDPIAIKSIQTRTGEELEVPASNCKQVLTSNVANGVTYALEDVLKSGSGRSSALAGGRPAAGKTGTTNSNINTWFVGYTPQLSTAVWVGNPDDQKFRLRNLRLGGQRYGTIYGSTLAAPMWKRYMDIAHQGIDNTPFPRVDDITLEGRRVGVPDVTGMLPDDARRLLEQEGFRVNQSTDEVDSAVPQGRVATTSPAPNSRVPERSAVTLTLSTGVDPDAVPEQPEDSDDSSDDDDEDRGRGRGGGRGGRG